MKTRFVSTVLTTIFVIFCSWTSTSEAAVFGYRQEKNLDAIHFDAVLDSSRLKIPITSVTTARNPEGLKGGTSGKQTVAGRDRYHNADLGDSFQKPLYEQLGSDQALTTTGERSYSDTASKTTFLGQRRRKKGGGGLWLNMYMADTVLKDTRYTDLKIKPDLWGAQIGYDVKTGPMSRIGFFYNYNSNYTKWYELDSPLGKRFLNENHLIGLSYTSYGAISHILLRGSVGYDSYDLVMPGANIGEGAPLPHFTAEGVQTNLYGEFGFDLILPEESWAIKPYFALDYNYLFRDSFESSDYTFNAGKDTCNAFKSLLGLRINKRFNHFLEVQGRAAWIQQLLKDEKPIYNLNFSMINGTMTPTQYFFDGQTGRSWAWFGAGLKYYAGYTDVRLFFDYDVMLNEYHTSHLASFGLLLGW